jgi:hypothetical protein
LKYSGKACLGLVVLGSSLLFAACGDDDDAVGPGTGGAGTSEGVFECQVMGELCHEGDTGSGPAHDCHQQAHHGNGAECLGSFASCIGTCVTEGGEKDPRCAALGELCHAVDDQDGPLHECHELGHVNDADACAASFDDCAKRCLAAREALEAGGDAGGAGGAESAGGGAAEAVGGAADGFGGAAGSR